jgi:hypothetical protein
LECLRVAGIVDDNAISILTKGTVPLGEACGSATWWLSKEILINLL